MHLNKAPNRMLNKAIALAAMAAAVFNLLHIIAKPVEIRSCSHSLLQRSIRLYLDFRTRNYDQLSSDHFRFKYSAADKPVAWLTIEKAEEYLYSVKRILLDDSTEKEILLVLCPDAYALNEKLDWNGEKSAAGVYWAGSIVLLSPQAWAGSETSATELTNILAHQVPLSHELTHLLVDRRTGGNYPRWLSEGLAQYVEEQVAGFRLPDPLPEETNDLYPLKGLDKDFDRQENQALAYWQSLQTVKYLIEEHGMAKMKELLDALGHGLRMGQALSVVYGLDGQRLESRVKDYLSVCPGF